MAKDRLVTCEYYVCEDGKCLKDRTAKFYGYCQKCNLYVPRVSEKILNRKKEKLRRIKASEY